VEFKNPVSVLNPLAAIENSQSIPEEMAPAFAVAIGLALRKPNDWI
jgi:Tfp pilus assembly PilM family ATPase